MADCRAGQIDLIITKSVSRFGRNTVDVLKACRELKTLGVDILFEIENLWLSNQHSDLLLTILASCHQAESESKSGSIRWGIQRSFESPESRYHNRTCFGYQKGKDGHLAIRDDEAAIVRLIFALYAEGMSIRQVIHELERVRRYVGGFINGATSPANPVLILAKFARGFVFSANAVQKHGVHLQDQAQAKRAPGKGFLCQPERFAVVQHFPDVLGFVFAVLLSSFVFKNFLKSGLRPFDL